MITENLQKAINDQITAELWSSNLYLQMSFYMEKEGWDGAAHWLAKQSEEEKEHAMDMAHYLIKRGGTAKVSMIDVVPEGWGDYAEVFKNVYDHECHVSELINSLVDVASAEKDKATQDFLWNYVRDANRSRKKLRLQPLWTKSGKPATQVCSTSMPSWPRDNAGYKTERQKKEMQSETASPFSV